MEYKVLINRILHMHHAIRRVITAVHSQAGQKRPQQVSIYLYCRGKAGGRNAAAGKQVQ
jgi:hypothetical protein